MTKFEIGDQVRLKSGGPLMTVTRATARHVVAEWFNEFENRRTESFPAAALQLEPDRPDELETKP